MKYQTVQLGKTIQLVKTLGITENLTIEELKKTKNLLLEFYLKAKKEMISDIADIFKRVTDYNHNVQLTFCHCEDKYEKEEIAFAIDGIYITYEDSVLKFNLGGCGDFTIDNLDWVNRYKNLGKILANESQIKLALIHRLLTNNDLWFEIYNSQSEVTCAIDAIEREEEKAERQVKIDKLYELFNNPENEFIYQPNEYHGGSNCEFRVIKITNKTVKVNLYDDYYRKYLVDSTENHNNYKKVNLEKAYLNGYLTLKAKEDLKNV